MMKSIGVEITDRLSLLGDGVLSMGKKIIYPYLPNLPTWPFKATPGFQALGLSVDVPPPRSKAEIEAEEEAARSAEKFDL